MWYGLYATILGVVAYFTGEMVTFVMLGFILMALNNILETLKEMKEHLARQERQ